MSSDCDGKPRVLVERDGVIATVALSNPGKPNALTAAMWRDLKEIEANFAYFATEDYRIGMAAFAGKKRPKFVGR